MRLAIAAPTFTEKINEFISRRVDDLVNTETPLVQMFTEDAISLLKEKANDQIDPIIHDLAQLAAADKTRTKISALTKRERHDHSEHPTVVKNIILSRDRMRD